MPGYDITANLKAISAIYTGLFVWVLVFVFLFFLSAVCFFVGGGLFVCLWGFMCFLFWFFFNTNNEKKKLLGVGGNFVGFPARSLVYQAKCFTVCGLCSNSFPCERLSVIVVLHDFLLLHFFQGDTFLFCFAWVLSLIVM